MSDLIIRNAKIKEVFFGIGDYGFLTFNLTLDYGGSCQVFGNYALYNHSWPREKDISGWFVNRVLEITESNSINDICFKNIRVRQTHEKVHAIGHIIKDEWFDPSEEL